MKIKKLLVVLAATMLFAVTACTTSAPPDEQQAPDKQESGNASEIRPEVGYRAPDFILSDLEGNEIRLSDFKGKPVFINFWATWCPPCRAEMPDIQEVYEEKKNELIVLGVNLTYTERTNNAASKYIADEGYTFPVLLDPEGVAAQKYLVRSYPTSFFLDQDGVIQHIRVGLMDKKMMENAIDKASR